MKRTFIAIKLLVDDRTLGFINLIKSQLGNEKIRWLNEDNYHLTLFFIGDTDP